ncbi:MAG: class I SAM-dependent DNA methyltransferase [Bryobacteraceae bacterium]
MQDREARRARGEYYTPRWLGEIILDESGFDGTPGCRLLDPSCGPGVFLVLAIERARRRGACAKEILASIHGYEQNPESVRAARAAYLEALGGLAAEVSIKDVPVLCRDAILDPPKGELFDYVVGNPPWVRWDYLPPAYREATLPLWKHYGLFSLKGFEARLGAGKKDLSMLFSYAAADFYLKPGGTLAFLITQEVFKSKAAGEGFRRFRLGEQGPLLGVLRVHDFVKLRPFGGAVNKTAAFIATKGKETHYPVPYFVWGRDRRGQLHRQAFMARPLGGPLGPWQTRGEGIAELDRLEGTNPYRAVLGANANPYGVFWLEVCGAPRSGLVEVRNRPEMGKKPIPPVTAVVESDLVYPAARGSDLQRWRASAGVHVLAVQDPATRSGYSQDLMRRKYPRTLEYLERFREELLSRALYRKYHQERARPFYSQFNVSPATFAPFKVVWKRMASDLAAAVISEWDGPLGSKLLLPLETTAFIGVGAAEEAHYLCAILNSTPVRAFVRSFSSSGRGFGAPFVVGKIRIPGFAPDNPLHQRLADISMALHENDTWEQEREIDRLVMLL